MPSMIIIRDLTNPCLIMARKKIDDQQGNGRYEQYYKPTRKDIFKSLHATTIGGTFFSSAHETLSKIDRMQSRITRFNKLKKIEATQSMFSDHKGTKLETDNKNDLWNSQI